ncbi:ABC transporter permease [Actinomadura sp. 7K507]|uniref:ABC transporter permease n=1 Tax=Actinomadura sp. 7K507 TaxID=2530365 RepID=UPI00104940E7|nr:ABC transporter permease [Actinomadura sp. 7K507]TDC92284.1 ABC transporter permease [Actinomadura sp. 7K507]
MSRLEVDAPASKGEVPAGRGAWRSRSSVFWLSVPLVAVAALVFVLPVTGLLPEGGQDLTKTRLPPAFLDGGTWGHPLGTDKRGQDMLTQLMTSGRLTIMIGLVGALVAIGPGVLIGLLGGYFRGWADKVISILIDAQLALPFILIALAIISNRGSSLPVLFLVLALTGWAACARVTRATTLTIREQQFVLGLRAVGASEARIIFRHVLPNLAGTIVALGTLQVGTAILVESALSFLGLGVVPPKSSWGSMLASGQDELSQAWWIAFFPGLAITVLVLLVNLLGDALLTHHDPRKRRR